MNWFECWKGIGEIVGLCECDFYYEKVGENEIKGEFDC